MTKEHKIIKYNLQDEVEQLHTAGMAYHEIAGTIKGNHPEIADLHNLSAMAIQRYLKDKDEKQIVEDVKQGKDPVKDFIEEYREAMKDIDRKSSSLYDRSVRLLDSIEQSDDDILKMKALKEVRDSLHLLKDNQVALVQYGERKVNTINNVYLKKEIHVKNLLMEFNKCLCGKCKKNVADMLELEVD